MNLTFIFLSILAIFVVIPILIPITFRHSDLPYDEMRLNLLIKTRENNEEYKQQQAEKHREWYDSVLTYLNECLSTTRSFIPVNVHEVDVKSMEELGLTSAIVRRVRSIKALWLCRMAPEDISKISAADLQVRHSVVGMGLDIVEIAAIYRSLPEVFVPDTDGKKTEWLESVIRTLKEMIAEQSQGRLLGAKKRNACYKGIEAGPISDRYSVRMVDSVIAKNESHPPRKSFTEVCAANSILSKRNSLSSSSAAAATAAASASAAAASTSASAEAPKEVDGEAEK